MKYLFFTLAGASVIVFLLKYKQYDGQSLQDGVYNHFTITYKDRIGKSDSKGDLFPNQQEIKKISKDPSENETPAKAPPENAVVKVESCKEEPPIPAHLQKYVSFSCGNGGRLGNQFWPLFSMWSVGMTLGRRLYLNCDNRTMEMMRHIQWIFPKIGGIYEVLKPKDESLVALAYEHGGPGIHAYEDPKIYLNRTERYLKMDNYYAQNALFIAPYRKQIDSVLEFGAEITDIGENIIKDRNITVDNVMCAHIRQGDFKPRKWDKSYEDCLASVRYVANMKLNRTLIVMGDDKKFMQRMVNDLVASGDVAEDSFYSNYTRAEDLYLARRLCKTFVITSEGSTFGFWLAWVAGEGSDIYYLNEDRTEYHIPQFDSEFPLPWRPINVVNGVVAA